MKAFELERKNFANKVQKEKSRAEELAGQLANVKLTLSRKIGDQHKIFGSVTSKDIEAALKAKGFDIDRKMIIHDEQIKHLGEFKIKIKLHSGVETELKLNVIGEES